MRLRSALVLVLLALSCQAAQAEAPPTSGLEGFWVGRCQIDGKDTFLLLRLKHEAGRTTALVQSFALGLVTTVSDVQADGGRVALSFQAPQGTVRLTCDLREEHLVGTAEYNASSGPCALRRAYKMDAATFDTFRGDYQLSPDQVIFAGHFASINYRFLSDGDLRVRITPVGPREFLADDLRTIHFELDEAGKVVAANISQPGQQPRRAARVRLYTEEPVTFSNGAVRLAGTLTLPPGPGPHPALVFVHGSGPGPREYYALEADRFARHGIASLSFDKRGSGESTGNWQQADFGVLADDVLAAVQFLRRDGRIRPDKVGLLGISQAGWIIPLAASRSEDVAFIVPISGGAVMPAEQELWRQRQNLQYMGVPERFIEVERRVAAMAYEWQRRNQVGSMPIPNPFADDNLNMFHDAVAVLRNVRQPVLAILGGMDTLTPPRESAAIWADTLRQRGDRDYSVRLFPRGNHGLNEGGKTGSPLEILPEQRRVPGYFDTIVKWIHHHVDGSAFSQARQVDVDPDVIPVESRGMHEVTWYGSGAVQPWQLLLSLVVFTSAVLAAPAGWVWRRVRRREDTQPARWRRGEWLAALLGLVNVGILVAFTYVSYQLVATPQPMLARLALIWNALALAAWLSVVLIALLVLGTIRAWRNGWGSQFGRGYRTLVVAVSLCWVPFLFYWDLLRPTW
jgi:dienelactone hydrolase